MDIYKKSRRGVINFRILRFAFDGRQPRTDDLTIVDDIKKIIVTIKIWLKHYCYLSIMYNVCPAGAAAQEDAGRETFIIIPSSLNKRFVVKNNTVR